MGKRVRIWLLALMVLAGAIMGAETAHAHEDAPADVTILHADADPDHAVEGHPGHCHSGAVCGGVALMAGAQTAPGIHPVSSGRAVPSHDFRVLGPVSFDPPPPKHLT